MIDAKKLAGDLYDLGNRINEVSQLSPMSESQAQTCFQAGMFLRDHRPRIGVYAGSFDPPTFGHISLILRAARMVDTLYVAIGVNPAKKRLFTAAESVALLKECVPKNHLDNVEVVHFGGLLGRFCLDKNADYLFRGLRNAMDFNYEFELNAVNQDLMGNCQPVYLFARPDHQFISSSTVRELASHCASVSKYVPINVQDALRDKFPLPG